MGLRQQDFISPSPEGTNTNLEPEDILNPGVGLLGIDKDLRAKDRICAHILSSAFFDMNEEEMRHFYKPNMFDSTSPYFSTFLNPYKVQEIVVGGSRTSEHVFACSAWNRRARRIKEYLVSRIYNTNESTDFEAEIVRARFIFGLELNRFKVIAIAEEPAVADKRVIQDTNLAYYRERNYATPRRLSFNFPKLSLNF